MVVDIDINDDDYMLKATRNNYPQELLNSTVWQSERINFMQCTEKAALTAALQLYYCKLMNLFLDKKQPSTNGICNSIDITFSTPTIIKKPQKYWGSKEQVAEVVIAIAAAWWQLQGKLLKGINYQLAVIAVALVRSSFSEKVVIAKHWQLKHRQTNSNCSSNVNKK